MASFSLGQGYIIANTVAAGKIGNGYENKDRLYQFNQGGNPDTLNVWGFYSGNGLGANNVVALDANDIFKLTGDWTLDGYGTEGSGTGISGQIFHDNNGHKLLISGGQVDGYVGSANPFAASPNITIAAPVITKDQATTDINAMQTSNKDPLVRKDEIQTAINNGTIDHTQFWQGVVDNFDKFDNNKAGGGKAVAGDDLINLDDILANAPSNVVTGTGGGEQDNGNTDATQLTYRDIGNSSSTELVAGNNGNNKKSYVILKDGQELNLTDSAKGKWTKVEGEEGQVDVPKDPTKPNGETQKATMYTNTAGEELAVVVGNGQVQMNPVSNTQNGVNGWTDSWFDSQDVNNLPKNKEPFVSMNKDYTNTGISQDSRDGTPDTINIDNSSGMRNMHGIIAAGSEDMVNFTGEGWLYEGPYMANGQEKGKLYSDGNGNKVMLVGDPMFDLNGTPTANSNVSTLTYRDIGASTTPRLSAGENPNNKEAYVILKDNQTLTLADTSLGTWSMTEEKVDVPKDPTKPNGETQKATIYKNSAGETLAVVTVRDNQVTFQRAPGTT